MKPNFHDISSRKLSFIKCQTFDWILLSRISIVIFPFFTNITQLLSQKFHQFPMKLGNESPLNWLVAWKFKTFFSGILCCVLGVSRLFLEKTPTFRWKYFHFKCQETRCKLCFWFGKRFETEFFSRFVKIRSKYLGLKIFCSSVGKQNWVKSSFVPIYFYGYCNMNFSSHFPSLCNITRRLFLPLLFPDNCPFISSQL